MHCNQEGIHCALWLCTSKNSISGTQQINCNNTHLDFTGNDLAELDSVGGTSRRSSCRGGCCIRLLLVVLRHLEVHGFAVVHVVVLRVTHHTWRVLSIV